MEAKELIQSFVAERLEGDVDKLATFELGLLRNDDVYGNSDRRFDSDDTNLMRAIYVVVFGDTWENLSMDNAGDGKLRGDTINTYSTLFSAPWKERFIDIWHPSEDFLVKRKNFLKTCYTMGNMTVLPDRRIGEWSINKHRGCHDEWHDYEDRFLVALHKVLLQLPDLDEDLKDLVELNKTDFAPFYGEEGWRRFIRGNMLEYYVDENHVPVVSSKGYVYWRGGYTDSERFLAECCRYMDFSTEIIDNRAKRMISIIKERCF